MTAFDTDVFAEILSGNAAFVARCARIPVVEQAVPIIVLEEILRGRLHSIRQAEAGKGQLSIGRAYELLELTISKFQGLQVLSYTSEANAQFGRWRQQRIRASTHDLRIAAICVAHPAKLVTRNRRDFDRIPGLDVEFWQ